MSAYFLEHVCHIQPRGPYRLAGTSFGGVVAFEMAHQLRRAGQEVELLALLDTFGPGYPREKRGLGLRARWKLFVRGWLPQGQKGEFSWPVLRRGVRERFLRVAANLDMRLRWRLVPPMSFRFLYLQEVCFRARRRYFFKPVDARVDLFRAKTRLPPEIYEDDPELGWHGMGLRGLAVRDIPGYHGVHIREPNVGELARLLCARLAEVRTAGSDGAFTAHRDEAREAWDDLAPWWDRQIGDDGNLLSVDTLVPATEDLLRLRPGERILDVACGNGWFSRRLSRQGARVVGFDHSAVLIEKARARTPAGVDAQFHVADATREDQLLELVSGGFDAAVATMALMDIADIAPLLRALRRLVKADGRFVFSMIHPHAVGAGDGAEAVAAPLVALPGQPSGHIAFHRPLPLLRDIFRRAGWRLEEEKHLRLDVSPRTGVTLSWVRVPGAPIFFVGRAGPEPVS
jgi:thioesterase domain-containing protein/SAM-dependent methyltransferase